MKKTHIFLLLWMGFVSNLLRAQSAPATHITLGQAMVALNGPWKFHIGDSPQENGAKAPRWADRDFDDSQWETVDLMPKAGSFDPNEGLSGYVPGWTAKGHPGYWGYAWYRIRVQVASGADEKLALAGPSDVDDAYQVFANGTLLGSFGKFSVGHAPATYYSQPAMFVLPLAAISVNNNSSFETSPATQVLAFRVWMNPHTLTFISDAGGFHNAPLLGEARVVNARNQMAWLELIRGTASDMVVTALFFLMAIVTCSLVLFDRSDPVYRWLAAIFLVSAIGWGTTVSDALTQVMSAQRSNLVSGIVVGPLYVGGWVMVWWAWFRLNRPTWVPKVILAMTLFYSVSYVLDGDLFYINVPHSVRLAWHTARYCNGLLLLLLSVLIVTWGIRQQGREGWLVLPAVVLVGVARLQGGLSVLHVRVHWFPFGILVSLAQISGVALVVAVFALLLRRLLFSLRRQRELALDIKQAQEVQRMLIPAHLPQVPGLTIESEYHPAREVGGDFFQILPHAADGSVLIVVGDVSGKGLKAAMTVSTIVGALRGCTTRKPADVLAYLNRVLHGQIKGFVTCCAAWIAADGAMTLANAGHLSPYRNGTEMVVNSGLPLGILAVGNYEETHYQLATGDRLTFVSDGVVEATNEKRELFGFERTQAISNQPANSIAEAAKQFGQEDDISVLSVQVLAELLA